MKRGLITWDERELSRGALEERLERARRALKPLELPALVVYTDVWRSNTARSLVNFMPFWGRSLLVVPLEGRPVLLCGNSPRVYPWLSGVTFVEELRPTKDFGARLLELASERGWRRIGVLDRTGLPYDIERALTDSDLELVEVEPWEGLGALDPAELAMRRKTIGDARKVVEGEIERLGECSERDLVAGLERALRRGGMEDVLVRVSTSFSAPRLATEQRIDGTTSVFVACEYRGHWAQLTRPLHAVSEARREFVEALKDLRRVRARVFDLGDAFPYRALPRERPLVPGRLIAIHMETEAGTRFGDTCIAATPTSAELL